MTDTGEDVQKAEARRFGERLRWVRELVSGTPTQLGADVGVDSSTIRHIERGVRLPSLFLFQSLCHVLQVTPQYLLWGSLEGVEPELAALLVAQHPELLKPATPHIGGKRGKPRPSTALRPNSRARYYAPARS